VIAFSVAITIQYRYYNKWAVLKRYGAQQIKLCHSKSSPEPAARQLPCNSRHLSRMIDATISNKRTHHTIIVARYAAPAAPRW